MGIIIGPKNVKDDLRKAPYVDKLRFAKEIIEEIEDGHLPGEEVGANQVR